MSPKILRVWVDEKKCLSHWACVIAPEVFVDTGKFHPVIPPDASRHFESDRERIIEAVLGCPMAALFIEFDDGKVISAKNYDASKGIQEWIIPNDSAKRRVRPS